MAVHQQPLAVSAARTTRTLLDRHESIANGARRYVATCLIHEPSEEIGRGL